MAQNDNYSLMQQAGQSRSHCFDSQSRSQLVKMTKMAEVRATKIIAVSGLSEALGQAQATQLASKTTTWTQKKMKRKKRKRRRTMRTKSFLRLGHRQSE